MSIDGARKRVNVSENLFSADDEGDDDSSPSSSAPSPELAALMGSVEKRTERRKAKPKTIAAAVFGRTTAEVEEMIRSGDWSGVGAKHLVALYELMHKKCYGIAPAELGPAERYNAMMMAASLTKREFGESYERAMEYMRWAWTKELKTEKWRRENGRTDGRRIGVRLMFSGALVTDFRLHLARTRA